MKKFLISLIILIATCELNAQLVPDTAALRALINQWIVPSQKITAPQLNKILNETVKFLGGGPSTTADSSLFKTNYKSKQDSFALSAAIALKKDNSDSTGDAGYITLDQFKKTKDSLQANINSKSKRLGTIYNVTLNTSSSSLYTDTSPQSTFTFTSGGITTATGNSDLLNWLEYTGYSTNASYFTRKIRIIGTTDGDGIGLGINSGNGKMLGRLIMTGVDKGKITIETNRIGVTTSRIVSTTAISYTNNSSVIELVFTKSMTNWKLTAQVLGTSSIVAVEWTDPLTYGSVSSIWAAGKPAIYHLGGSQIIIKDSYSVDIPLQPDLLIYANSLGSGAYCGGADKMFANILSQSILGGVALIAGGGNSFAQYTALKPEIFSLKPKIILFENGMNDIIGGTSNATIQANILSFIKDCLDSSVIPVIATIAPVGTSYASSSTLNANAVIINSFINSLENIKVIDIYSAVALAGVLNPLYNAGDHIHINADGNRVYAQTIAEALKGLINITPSMPFKYNSNTYELTHNNAGGALFQITNSNPGTTSSSSFRTASDVATGYFTTLSSTSSTLGYANKTVFTNNGTGVIISATDAAGAINFLTGSNVLATNERMRINANGSVGIGTTTADPLTISYTYGLGMSTASGSNQISLNAAASSSIINLGVGGIRYLSLSALPTASYLGTHGDFPLIIRPNVVETARFTTTGFGIGVTTASAKLHLGASSITAGSAPLKFTLGTKMTTPELGAEEYDGTDRYQTNSTAVRGSYEIMRGYTSSVGTLTLGYAYTDYVFTGTTSTWTLPAVVANYYHAFYFKNAGSGTVTINTNAGGNDIYNTSATNTYSLTAGSKVLLRLVNGVFYVE